MTRTLDGFERELRRALKDRRVKLVLKDQTATAAWVDWEGNGEKGALVALEPYQRGLVYLVVHELTHWIRRKEFESWGELEEPMVCGISDEITRRIEGSPKRLTWWRNAIRSKLKGAV